MSRIRSRDTKPEVWVRSLLHRLGYRFRKNVKTLPGKPDIVLRKYNLAIFIHGCFWHQHPRCKRAVMPKSRVDYWKPKLKGNVERDRLHVKKLKAMNWNVLTIWECETKDQERVVKAVEEHISKFSQ